MDNLNFFFKIKFKWKSKKEARMEMCEKSTCLVTSLHLVQARNYAKKGQQEKIFFCSITHSFNVNKFYILHSF